MIVQLRTLLTATLVRLKRSEISVGLSIIVILSAVAFPVSQPFADKFWADDSAVLPGIAWLVAKIAICWLILHVSWRLTRGLSDYTDRLGAFWPWLGWGLLAYLPTLAIVLGLFIANGAEEYSYLEALAFACLPPLSVPLLVHASGRAIDATGPRAGEVLTFWSQRYLPLAAAYFLVTAPTTFISEALYVFAAGKNMLIDVAASIIYLPALILGTALTVEAFHCIPQKSPT